MKIYSIVSKREVLKIVMTTLVAILLGAVIAHIYMFDCDSLFYKYGVHVQCIKTR
jgi:hypothetical protein